MFASPSPINSLCSGHEGVGLLSLMDLDSISAVLRERRKDLERTDRYLSGSAMSDKLRKRFKKLGRSQGWISLLETGATSADIMTLQPEVRLYLLELYAFTPAEIADLNERFNLRLPLPDMKNLTRKKLSDFGSVESVTLRVLGNPALEGYTVSQYVLDEKGVSAESAFVLETTGSTLLCPEVRTEYVKPFRLLFDKTAEPAEGKPVAYKVRGQELYVLRMYHPDAALHPVVVKNYDDTHSLVLYPGDPELEYLGAAFGAHQVF